jgi:hypothetical protein
MKVFYTWFYNPEKFNQNFDRLRNVFEYSLKKNNPFIDLEALQVEYPTNTKNLFYAQYQNIYKLHFWNEKIQTTDCPILLIDCDMLCLKDINCLTSLYTDKDILLTSRSYSSVKYNAGVILVRPTQKSKKFFKRWLEESNTFDPKKDLWKERLKNLKIKTAQGATQTTLAFLLENEYKNNSFIGEIPCPIWNCTNYEWDRYSKETKFIHIKSELRDFVLNNRIEDIDYKEKKYMQLMAYKWFFYEKEMTLYNKLIFLEKEYGGICTNVKRIKVSKFDPRTKEELEKGGMVGGDRMCSIKHNYGYFYADFLKYFDVDERLIIAEIGILKGSGLASWSAIFKNSRILGFDIDLSHIKENMPFLKSKGAFVNNNLELYEYDQFQNNHNLLQNLLKTEKVNIVFDDGFHSDDTILTTFDSFFPFLANKFLYIIEDNTTAFSKIQEKYKSVIVKNYGELTIIVNSSFFFSI